jgi:2-polyprenyl-3-methyl-5-hydroxy-6-metoxy-1,4-benzoquinol methylase
MKIFSFIEIVHLYGKNFGYLRTTLKLLSYEFKSINSYVRNYKTVVDLGSGEGLLSAILKSYNPGINFICLDLNLEYLSFIEENNFILNLNTLDKDILNVSDLPHSDVYMLNDMLHHISRNNHEVFLFNLIQRVNPGGMILVRDVRKSMSLDYFLTKIIDRRLYPLDPLSYMTQMEWLNLMSKVTPRKFRLKKSFFGWPSNKLQVVIWK